MVLDAGGGWMRPARALLPVGLVLAVACVDASERTEGPPDTAAATDPQLVFWASLESLCGQAFRGHVVESEPPDASFEGQAAPLALLPPRNGRSRCSYTWRWGVG